MNADDNFRGIVEKTEFAESAGFHIIAPNQRGFNCNDILKLMVVSADIARSPDRLFEVVICN